MRNNALLLTDVYKLGHMDFYAPGTERIYSYLCARSDKKFKDSIFFGLQYYLKEYLQGPLTRDHAEEFFEYRKCILGGVPEDVRSKINSLVKLGYWPLKIKAVLEGTRVNNRNVLMTVTNTHEDFHWCVGYVESLLLKVWNTTTVATYSSQLKKLFTEACKQTGGIEELIPFQVHDFGYRGCSSEETAALSGMAHLVNFLGTDTITAIKAARQYYNADEPVGLSVPASEHSVMCSFGRHGEVEAFRNMLRKNPRGIVSIVSDTYNLWDVLTHTTDLLRDEILGRDGKVVFRPDSGDPEKILCGDPAMPKDTAEGMGVFEVLAKKFGTQHTPTGHRLLNPKIGVIYGDAMYYERIQRILARMDQMGLCSSNLVIGVGGLLLQQHNRDDLGFSFKATCAKINGDHVELFKDPITDPGKRSHQGLMRLDRCDTTGIYTTKDRCDELEEAGGELKTVFVNGNLVLNQSFREIRERAAQ